MTQHLKNIGKRLKAIRVQLDLSRREVFEKYKLPEITLASWEQGTKEIGVLNLINYLNFLKSQGIGVDIGTILSPSREAYLPSSNNDHLKAINLNLKNLENSNALFYANPEGIILYFNIKYKELLKNPGQNYSLLHLKNLFEESIVRSIIQTNNSAETAGKSMYVINLNKSLALEIYPNYDIFCRLEGILGILISAVTNGTRNYE